METITINIPIIIPKVLADQGAVEIYARNYAGWAPTIIVDEVEVPNDKTAEEASILYIQNLVKEQQRVLMVSNAKREAEVQMTEVFNQIFS